MFDCTQPLYSPAVWHNVNPLLDHRVQFTSLRTSQELLNYLQSNALVLELWGLQGNSTKVLDTMNIALRCLKNKDVFAYRGMF